MNEFIYLFNIYFSIQLNYKTNIILIFIKFEIVVNNIGNICVKYMCKREARYMENITVIFLEKIQEIENPR